MIVNIWILTIIWTYAISKIVLLYYEVSLLFIIQYSIMIDVKINPLVQLLSVVYFQNWRRSWD